MDLVEETASYLDGSGRQSSKLLSRNAALAYASESMRLTTRLMQVASWLLVQRAVREGDMAPDAACEDRYRLSAEEVCRGSAEASIEDLPPELLLLLDRSERLYERVRHLDRRMYVEGAANSGPHPVLSQFDRLKNAFGS
jgi:regulator of CtrA degradation